MVIHIDPGTAFGTGMRDDAALHPSDPQTCYAGARVWMWDAAVEFAGMLARSSARLIRSERIWIHVPSMRRMNMEVNGIAKISTR